MIVYASTKRGFLSDVLAGDVEKQILTSFIRELGHSTGKSEIASWRNSMQYMSNVINTAEIPEDAGVAIEYKIPQTSRRIDFILTGLSEEKKNTAVLIELKQWSKAELTNKDAIVRTFTGGNTRDVAHPSYQVWTYACLLEDYNDAIEKQSIALVPCAFLHNYEQDDVIANEFYQNYIDRAPLFLKSDALKLQEFIKRYVKYGDKNEIMYQIDHGKIRPSKNLADSLSSLLKGNQEFLMVDDQKVVYETALQLAERSSANNKNVLIVQGGPGTGKSVVAINMLVELISRGKVTEYVTRNAAPRQVYEAKLTGAFTKSRISNLFSNSGGFYALEPNTFDALIVDEAHRLTAKSGIFGNLGENQIKELINAAKFSIFFIDEDQKVTLKDIGEVSEIKHWAVSMGATVHELELVSQFRCNGSDGYLAWLDEHLQVRETANTTLEGLDYDFRVCDSAEDLRRLIYAKNEENNKARMVAGYCWNWVSKKDKDANDIVLGDFAAQWNLVEDGQAWIIKPYSVSEVGCIHTSQGLEVEYVGVIIGPDFVIRDGKVVTDAAKRAATDQSVKGYKAMLKNNPEEARALADAIIKNTYRTLMTRGQRGCYIYCTDPETQTYFKQRLTEINEMRLSYSLHVDGASITLDT